MPLPEPIPDLASLDLLVSVGELGSISAAAAVHGISQPAASMRLSSLERALGLQLLERRRTGSRLTAAGAATVEWASVLLYDAAALVAGVGALRADQRSRLLVAASMTVAEYLVPLWIRRLALELPEIQVSLQMGNTAHVGELVESEEVEIGFIEGPHPPGRLRARELVLDELVVVVAKEHPWARRRGPLGARELADTRLILREQGSGTREVLAQALADLGLEARPAIELASTTAIKSAAIAGDGPAVLSVLAVENERRSGQLVVVPCLELDLTRTIRAVWRSGRSLSLPASRLVALAESKS